MLIVFGLFLAFSIAFGFLLFLLGLHALFELLDLCAVADGA